MTIQQAKEVDLVNYLSGLGHDPAKISGTDYWYLSPFRDEKNASFKVNRKINRWYDFAEGKGGNIVDFGTLYHRCSVSDFLRKLDGPAIAVKQHQRPPSLHPSAKANENSGIKILSAQGISSFPLIRYLHSRGIEDPIADKYLREICYQNGNKIFFALGFKNDSGGYELRSEHSKISSSPKDITFLDNGAKELAVFEGFFDFLSYQNIYYKKQEPLCNFLILNSTSFFEKSIPKMMEHERVNLYLDNDPTGQKFTLRALSINKEKFIDQRELYQNYKDLNEYTIRIGTEQKQQFRQKP